MNRLEENWIWILLILKVFIGHRVKNTCKFDFSIPSLLDDRPIVTTACSSLKFVGMVQKQQQAERVDRILKEKFVC